MKTKKQIRKKMLRDETARLQREHMKVNWGRLVAEAIMTIAFIATLAYLFSA